MFLVPDLREDREFTDVTLACGDGRKKEEEALVGHGINTGRVVDNAYIVICTKYRLYCFAITFCNEDSVAVVQ